MQGSSFAGMTSGDADMADMDYRQPWYHRSQQRLTMLRAGSSITQYKRVAKAFSHRPSIVIMSDGGEGEQQAGEWNIRHDGVTFGYLYVVADEVEPADVRPHLHPVSVSHWEWLTNREMKIRLIEETTVADSERLTDEEIAKVKRKQREKGELSFVESSE